MGQTSHVRRLLITLTLVACWRVGSRVCHCTPLILCFKTARSPRGPPASPPTTLLQQTASQRLGTPSHAHNSATWSDTGTPRQPSSKLQTGNCPPLGKHQPSALLASNWGHPACQLSFKRATAQPPGDTPQTCTLDTEREDTPQAIQATIRATASRRGNPDNLAKTPRVPTRHH